MRAMTKTLSRTAALATVLAGSLLLQGCLVGAVVGTAGAIVGGTARATGAVVALEVTGVPAGWGAPLYGKLDAELAAAMMSINAVKGIEIGAGFGSAELSGEENADEMRLGADGEILFGSNNAGGVLGGISTGQPLTARVVFKPTSSILTPRQTVTRDGTETDLRTTGRHDPCVALRGVPVVEAMAACVLADAMLRHRAQVG